MQKVAGMICGGFLGLRIWRKRGVYLPVRVFGSVQVRCRRGDWLSRWSVRIMSTIIHTLDL